LDDVGCRCPTGVGWPRTRAGLPDVTGGSVNGMELSGSQHDRHEDQGELGFHGAFLFSWLREH